MKKTGFFLVLSFGAIAFFTSNHIFAAPQIEIADSQGEYTGVAVTVDRISRQITVLINSPNDDFWSGVIVAKHENTYYVLTTDYRFKNPDRYTLVAPDGQSYPIDNSKVTVLEGTGLAVIPFTSSNTYSVATLADYELENEWTFVSGFPQSETDNAQPQILLTAGAASSVKDSDSLYGLVYTNHTRPGMGGGAILDSRGYLIGIHAAAESEWVTTEDGRLIELNLGRSLGIAIASFLNNTDRAKIESNWLTVETSAPSRLTRQDVETIHDSLRTPKRSDANTSENNWQDRGEQLWRMRENE